MKFNSTKPGCLKRFTKTAKFIFVLGFILILSIRTVQAQTITLTTTVDEVNGNTASIAALIGTPGGAGISLREAIIATNNEPVGSTVTINIPAGNFALTIVGAGENAAATGDLDLNNTAAGTKTIIIDGAGAASTTITGLVGDRVFDIHPLTAAGAFITFTLSNVTVTGASLAAGSGGVLLTGRQGDITNLTNCIFNNNAAASNGGVISQSSAGAAHDLNITNCTFTNNTATGAVGGAVNYSGLGNVTITGCTFSGSTAGTQGGAINISGSAPGPVTTSITKNTFLNNVANGATFGGAAIGMVNVQTININFNRIFNNNAAGVANGKVITTGGGAVVAMNFDNNWWGVNTGPAVTAILGTAPTRWLQVRNTASPSPVCIPATSTITASFLNNNLSEAIAAANLTPLVGLPITFNAPVNGTLSSPDAAIQATGTASVTFTPTAGGSGSANAVFVPLVENFTTTTNPTITINTSSTAPTGATGTTTICNPGSTTLTVSGGTKGIGATTEWFTGSCGGTSAGTGDAITVSPTVTTTYYVRYSGTCNTTTCATVTVTVNDVTGGSVGSDQTICSGGDPAAFTESIASTGSGVLTYQWQSSTTSCAAGFSNIAGATGTTYDIPSGLLVTTFYRRVTTSTLNAVACSANSNCITVTVNDVTGGTVATNQTICFGLDPAAFTQTVASTGNGVLTYQWQSSTTDCSTGFTNIAGATATTYDAPAGLTQTTYYRRLTTSTLNSVTCTANSNCITVTVTPNNTITLTSAPGTDAQTVLINTPITNITYSTTGATGATFSGLPAGVTGTWAANVVTISGTPSVSGTFNYTVNLTGGCGTVTASGTITVIVCSITLSSAPGTDAQTVCNNSPIVNITYNTTGATGATFSGLPAGVNGNWAANVVTISGTPTATGTFNYTITPTGGGCSGTVTATGTITVNPVPNVNAVTNQTYCAGASVPSVVFTSSVAGAVFFWSRTVPTPDIGLGPNSGTGNVPAFTATNTSNAPITATFSVVASYTNNGVTCTGTPIQFTITVNPLPNVNPVANQTYCAGASVPSVVFTSSVAGSVFFWSRTVPTPDIGLGPNSGTGNVPAFTATNTSNAPITATFSVVASYTNNGVTCTGTPIQFTITVNPLPNVNPVANQTYCAGASVPSVVFSSGVAGSVFFWSRTVPTPDIGLGPNSGTGNVPAFTATNTSNAPITATFSVVASYTNNGVTCTGTPIQFTITVNPTPDAVATPASQTICSAGTITTIVLSGAVSGTTFNWTRDNTVSVTGIAAAGSGNISGSLTNTTNAPVTVTFTITPTANGCPGTPVTATVLVNPTPNAVATPSSQTVCSGVAMTTIVLSGNVTGTTYNWTRDNQVNVTGIPNSGSGNISGTPINNTVVQQTVTFTITPTANGCPGTPITATLIVNKAPTITCPANITVNNTPGQCGAIVNYPPATATGAPAPVITYSQASGTFFRVGTTTVTCTATNICGTVSCTFTITVIDNEPPVITCPANITVNNTPNLCSAVVNYPLPTATDNCCLPGAVSLTQTASQTPTAGSVACNAGGFHTNNSYWRAYDLSTICLSGPLTVNTVQFGIELADANGTGTTQPITIRVYRSAGAFPGGVRTLLSTQVVNVPDQTLSLFNVTLTTPAVFATTDIMVLELFSPDGRAPANNRFFIGSNASAQTGPSYISAADCGIPNPTNLATLGFPNMHIILNANGVTAGPNPITQIAGLPSGSAFPVGVTTNTFRATDAAGNTSTCSFTVTVVDNQPPTVSCPANIVRNTDPGVCTATITVPDPTTSDNCAVTQVTWVMTGATTASSPATGINYVGTRAFNLNGTTGQGVTTITYTVKDPAGNSATCSFTVTVNDASIPVIGAGGQPTNQTVCAGTNAIFSVTASVPAGNPLNYQWQAWNGTAWVDINGATASTLTLNAVTFSMNTNSYRCKLTGRCSEVISGFATLYVNPLPTISLLASRPLALLPGQSLNITAIVNPGGGSYVWRKNGAVITGATGSSLTGLTVDDIGTYKCTYTDLNGCVSSSLDMVVTGQVSDNLYIYPNPNSGHFHVRLYNQANEEITIRVFDMKGALVYLKKAVTTLAYTDIEVDISGDRITAGETYLVTVNGNGGRLIGSKKIQILK